MQNEVTALNWRFRLNQGIFFFHIILHKSNNQENSNENEDEIVGGLQRDASHYSNDRVSYEKKFLLIFHPNDTVFYQCLALTAFDAEIELACDVASISKTSIRSFPK